MSNIVTGRTIPKDLLAVLKKYGLPEHCTGFFISCTPHEPLTLTFTCYARMPSDGETFEDVTETRKFKLLEID